MTSINALSTSISPPTPQEITITPIAQSSTAHEADLLDTLLSDPNDVLTPVASTPPILQSLTFAATPVSLIDCSASENFWRNSANVGCSLTATNSQPISSIAGSNNGVCGNAANPSAGIVTDNMTNTAFIGQTSYGSQLTIAQIIENVVTASTTELRLAINSPQPYHYLSGNRACAIDQPNQNYTYSVED